MNLSFIWNPDPVRAAMKRAGATIGQRAMEFMTERAKQYCPVDTGFLLNSIILFQDIENGRWYCQAVAHYSVPVEMGHMTTAGSWVPPNPFMRKAIADTAREWPNFGKGVHVGIGRPDEADYFLQVSTNP